MLRARFVISVVAAAALVPLTATSAFAAPPANDTPDGAVALSLGDTYQEDTTEATTDQTDSRANELCGAPFTNASVWFSYTAEADGAFVADMSQSDYTGGFMVFKGTPTPRHLIACGPDAVAVPATSGTTYLMVAFSDTEKNGGNLKMSLEEGPPPPTMNVTIDPTGTVLPKGKAEISGTLKCTDSEFLEIDGQLRQIWHRVKINGFFTKFEDGSLCDGKSHDWSRVVTSHNGLYAPGDATVRIFAGACGPIECTNVTTRRPITLSKGAPQGAVSPGAAPAVTHVSTTMRAPSVHWPTH
jgi:hypothetical protein